MSMNLVFKVKNVNAYVDFPFQTSTKLTHAVLNAEGSSRIQLIADHIHECAEYLSEGEQEILISECKELMEAPELELTLI